MRCALIQRQATHATQIALLARNSLLGILGNSNAVAVTNYIRYEGENNLVTNSREISLNVEDWQ